MASTTFTVMKSAIVGVAVASTMLVAVNAQASPAPAPASAGSTILPTLMAPAVGMLVALIAGLKLW